MNRSVLCLSASIVTAAAILAVAGPLDPPPGPVSPTYKTLWDVEPRIEINAQNTPGDADSLFRISQPGSYYLTRNITGVSGKTGIEIAASNVTIDLMGFTLRGVPGSLAGMDNDSAAATTGITIRNGVVSAWGEDGVNLRNTLAGVPQSNGALIEAVHVSSNGGEGIRVDEGMVIRACTARANAGSGFLVGIGSVLQGCSAFGNGVSGFVMGDGSAIVACVAAWNTGGGISAGNRATVRDCNSNNNGGGIVTTRGSVVTGCTVNTNRGYGIWVTVGGCLVQGNACFENTDNGAGTGIRVWGTDHRIDENNLVGNDVGLQITDAGNFVVRNSASGNTTNYDIAADNIVGVIFQGTLSGAILGSTGGSGTGSEAAWSNFSF